MDIRVNRAKRDLRIRNFVFAFIAITCGPLFDKWARPRSFGRGSGTTGPTFTPATVQACYGAGCALSFDFYRGPQVRRL